MRCVPGSRSRRLSRWPRPALALAAGLLATAGLPAPPPLHVAGSRLLRSDGRPARLRGVNCASLEWSNDGDGRMLQTVSVAVEAWHANLIRLPLSQDRWFGKAPGQSDGGAAYRALVHRLADSCAAHDAYLILDLHWSDAGVWGRNVAQHDLPDRNSVAFWKDAAPQFKDNPAVLFDLHNEPCHVDWDQWFRGGPIRETDQKTGATLTYDAVGLPALAAAIRSTGARNVIVAGGINWAYELGGVGFPRVGVAVPDLRLELHADAGIRRRGKAGARGQPGPVSAPAAAGAAIWIGVREPRAHHWRTRRCAIFPS